MYMTRPDLASDRLRNQAMSGTRLKLPEEVVAWLGAVQAQDYAGGLWSIGLRLPGTTSMDIENAIARRTIVMSWVLRGTLHFVAARDIHWMLALLAPGIIAKGAARYRQLGLDEKTFDVSNQAMEDELRGGRQRTRKDLLAVLEGAGISSAGQRGYHLLGRAGLDGVICFGPRSDRQQRFVLLDEWIPPSPAPDRDTALADLAWRYITSHGPATLQDFLWWSGLSAADARAALVTAGPDLHREQSGDRTYWNPATVLPVPQAAHTAYLLPAYDEYLLGYRDRTHAIDPADTGKINLINGLASPIVINGRVRGSWKRTTGTKKIVLSLKYFDPPDGKEKIAVASAADRYGLFMSKPLDIV